MPSLCHCTDANSLLRHLHGENLEEGYGQDSKFHQVDISSLRLPINSTTGKLIMVLEGLIFLSEWSFVCDLQTTVLAHQIIHLGRAIWKKMVHTSFGIWQWMVKAYISTSIFFAWKFDQ
jgi:hypothetical protein